MPAEDKAPQWITKRQQELKALHGYVADLERRNTFLIEELSSLSQGVYLASTPDHWTPAEKLTMRAAEAVKRCVNEFTVRIKPAVWW